MDHLPGSGRLDNRYRFRGIIITDTALHIGTTRATSVVTDKPLVRDAWGRPYIPGSTLKGALRSSVERLVRALDRPNIKSCALDPRSGVPCLSVSHTIAARPDGRDAEQYLQENLCATCSLFGSTLRAGRAAFADGTLEKHWSQRGEIRDGVAIDRDTERSQDRRKYDLEVVPAGTPFRFTVSAENVSDTDLALLALGLLELAHGELVLGGGKSRGLGRCHANVEYVERVRFGPEFRDELLPYLRDHTMSDVGAPVEFLSRQLESLLSA